MINNELRETLSDLSFDEIVLFENPSFDDSIIALSSDDRVVYSKIAMIDEYMKEHNCSEMEAYMFIENFPIMALDEIEDDRKPIIAEVFFA